MRILEGIKVIDVTAWAFVPAAGGVMAHWGADVIKVESPGAPDPMRLMGGSLEPGRSSAVFKHYSRGKRSIAIDLASVEGQKLLYKLVADADVFLTSYLAPTRRKLKIDVEDIRRINPKIIYAKGSGQGPKGPDADRPGYDQLSWWNRGSLAQTGMDLSGEAWPVPMVGHGDGISGLVFAGGICAALLHRERTGEATVVDASLMGTAVWFNGTALLGAQQAPVRRNPGRAARKLPAGTAPGFVISAVRSIFQTQDFRFLQLMFLTDDDRDFVDLCQRMGRADLAAEARFATAQGRTENSPALLAIFEEVFAEKPLEEWKTLLATARGAWSVVQTPEDIFTDPQSIANGFISEVDYAGGALTVPAPPIMFDGEAGAAPPAPDFAAHTDAILGAHGFSAQDIAAFRAARVVV